MNLNLRSDKILFLHKGSITKELIELVVEALEQSVTNREQDRKIRRKITNVFIEVFQNIGFHGIKTADFSSSDMLILLSLPNFYKIGTTNLIAKEQQAKIEAHINWVNGLNEEELREAYKDALSNNELSEKGTAGLGLIDIARKTGQKLYYEFEPVNDEWVFFHFEVKIAKTSEEDEKPRRRKKSASIEE